MAWIERPVHPFTKLLGRPIAFLALLSWEIGRNRAKFRTSCCCPIGAATARSPSS